MSDKESILTSLSDIENDVIRMLNLASDTCRILSEIDPVYGPAVVENSKEYMKLAKDIQSKLIGHLDNLLDDNVMKNTISSYDEHRKLDITSMKTVAILEQLDQLKEDNKI